MRREIALLVAPLSASLLCSACAQGESAREEQATKAAIPRRLQPDGTIKLSASDRSALDLATYRAAERELADVALQFGRVRPTADDDIHVVSPVAGRIAARPAVQLGAFVKPGAALVDVAPLLSASERISVGMSGAHLRGQIEGVRRELATQEAALARARELARSHIVSEAKLQEAETSVATTRARLDALERAASVQTAGQKNVVTLRAPSQGTVVTLNASVGAVVHQGDLVARILKPGPRWVDVSTVPSEPVGQAYEVAVGSTWIPAKLVAAGAVVETDGTRHDRVEVDGPAAAPLIAGQTVAVRVARGLERGVVLPESALVPGVDTDLVFVETAAGTFSARPIRVAARFRGEVRLASGVRPGEDVVTRGAMALEGERRRRDLTRVE